MVIKYLENRTVLRYMRSTAVPDLVRQLTFESNSSIFAHYLESERFDLIVLGQNVVLPKEVIEAGSNRFINVHPARLPSYRGYAEPAHAILEGNDDDIGFSIHMLSPKLDQGGLIEFMNVKLLENDSLNSKLTKVRILGYHRLFREIARIGIVNYLNSARAQNEKEVRNVGILDYKKRFLLDLKFFIRRHK